MKKVFIDNPYKKYKEITLETGHLATDCGVFKGFLIYKLFSFQLTKILLDG